MLRRLPDWLFAPSRTRGHWLVLAVVLAASLALQWKVGHGFASQTNADMTTSDQAAYLHLARQNLHFWVPTVTDGARNPLFPWLLTPWYSPDEAQFFAAGKSVNVAFGMIASVVLGVYFLLRLPFLPSVVLTILGTYAVILPISVVVGAEVVFYPAFFFLWVCFCRLLAVDHLPTYAVGGLVCAIAYLAKPSTMLLTLAFFLLSTVRLRERWKARKLRGLIVGGSLFLVCFLLPVLPRASYARRNFGDPLQNASTYCFWTDSWEEAFAHLDFYSKRRIGELPESKRPSLGNYWRHHSVAQMADRLLRGIPTQARNFFLPEKKLSPKRKPSEKTTLLVSRRGAYPLALLGLTLVLCLRGRGVQESPEERRARLAWWTLSALAFALHFLAFAFYAPLAPGARFIMATYLPVLFALAVGVESLRKSESLRWREWLYRLTYAALAAALLSQILPLIRVTAFGEVRGAF